MYIWYIINKTLHIWKFCPYSQYSIVHLFSLLPVPHCHSKSLQTGNFFLFLPRPKPARHHIGVWLEQCRPANIHQLAHWWLSGICEDVSIYQIMSVMADTHNVISDSIVRYDKIILCMTRWMKQNYSGTSLVWPLKSRQFHIHCDFIVVSYATFAC